MNIDLFSIIFILSFSIRYIYKLGMSFISKGDFKTREQWLKKQKKATLKKEEQNFNKNKRIKQENQRQIYHKRQKLSQIVTLDTEQSLLPNAKQPKSQPHPSFKNQSDNNLYQSMRTRLKQQEQTCQKQRQQIIEVNRAIQKVKTDNAILKGVNSEIPSFQAKVNISQLHSRLKKECQQMESYLNSHGSFYEGSKIVGAFNIQKIKKDIKQAKTNFRTPSFYQFSSICKRVEELNENLMKQLGSKKITNIRGISKFIEFEKLSITFFKNCVKLDGIGSFSYSHKDGLKILQDLLDGYYPHVLKNHFPDGVYFEVQNVLEKEFSEQSNKNEWFFGKGHSLVDDLPQ